MCPWNWWVYTRECVRTVLGFLASLRAGSFHVARLWSNSTVMRGPAHPRARRSRGTLWTSDNFIFTAFAACATPGLECGQFRRSTTISITTATAELPELQHTSGHLCSLCSARVPPTYVDLHRRLLRCQTRARTPSSAPRAHEHTCMFGNADALAGRQIGKEARRRAGRHAGTHACGTFCLE